MLFKKKDRDICLISKNRDQIDVIENSFKRTITGHEFSYKTLQRKGKTKEALVVALSKTSKKHQKEPKDSWYGGIVVLHK